MSSKRKHRTRKDCPFPGCALREEHRGDHSPKRKGGPKPGPRWTPKMRAFVEHMKSGKVNQTDACRLAYPNCKTPDVRASQLMTHVLVVEALAEHAKLQKIAEEEAAKASAREVGKRRGIERGEILDLLADIARKGENEGARVRALMGLAELKHMRINRMADVGKEFEGRTEEELDFFAIHGYWPEEKQPLEPGKPGTA